MQQFVYYSIRFLILIAIVHFRDLHNCVCYVRAQ